MTATVLTGDTEVESTGADRQFYDKFNIRYEIFQVIKCIWPNDIYKQRLTQESKYVSTWSSPARKLTAYSGATLNFLFDLSIFCSTMPHTCSMKRLPNSSRSTIYKLNYYVRHLI